MATVRESKSVAPAQTRHRTAGLTAYRARRFVQRAGTYLILIALALVTIFPLLWMLSTSVKEPQDVFSGSLLPATFNVSTYQQVWVTMDFVAHFANSAFVTALTVAIIVAVATVAGYAFARFSFPGRDVIFYIFLASMIIPGQVILIPMFIFLKQIGLLNSLVGLSGSYLGGGLPFAIFLLRAFFKTLPNELADAAKIDGCSELGVFLRIFLPLARPGLATVTIFQFVGTWNEFLFATTFISSPELKTLQSALYLVVGRYSTDWTLLSAALTMAIAPVVLVYLLLQRQFVKGLTAGAIKG
ncbi:MAG TPA: carbohydrate ABC transporter permease [Chloroflexota bacterium]|nr:carbohydrate ABC transporter permease [Chloroflexota bacterium]